MKWIDVEGTEYSNAICCCSKRWREGRYQRQYWFNDKKRTMRKNNKTTFSVYIYLLALFPSVFCNSFDVWRAKKKLVVTIKIESGIINVKSYCLFWPPTLIIIFNAMHFQSIYSLLISIEHIRVNFSKRYRQSDNRRLKINRKLTVVFVCWIINYCDL